MDWRQLRFRASEHYAFSGRPLRVWPVVAAVQLFGVLLALTSFFVFNSLFPQMAGFFGGVGYLAGSFMAVFLAVHVLRWVEPIALIKTTYRFFAFGLLAGLGGAEYQGIPLIPDVSLGVIEILLIGGIGGFIPLIPIVLAVADRMPDGGGARPDDPILFHHV